MAGVTVGVMALIVVIAVMSGAEADFRTRILGLETPCGLDASRRAFFRLSPLIEASAPSQGIESASPFIYSQIMLRSSSAVAGAV
jgi:lipoprotein-releasing system permease protein